jgi:hypothetical protein
MQLDLRAPDGGISHAKVSPEHFAKRHFFFPDVTSRRFTGPWIPRFEAASTAFQGKSTSPVTGCVRSAIPMGTSRPTLVSARELRPPVTGYAGAEAERTIDWTSTTDVGRNGDPSCRDENTGHWGDDNG